MNDRRRETPRAELPRRARGRASAQQEILIRRRPAATQGALLGDGPEEFGVPEFERRIRA